MRIILYLQCNCVIRVYVSHVGKVNQPQTKLSGWEVEVMDVISSPDMRPRQEVTAIWSNNEDNIEQMEEISCFWDARSNFGSNQSDRCSVAATSYSDLL